MYKLLTPEMRKVVKAEYSSRRTRAALLLINLALAFTILALLPSLIIALGRRNAALVDYAVTAGRTPSVEVTSLISWAEAERQKLAVLSPISAPTPYEYFQEVLKAKPQGLRITFFSFSGNTVVVRGVSPDRQTLLQFQGSLLVSEKFGKADFPVDNLAKNTDIDFQLNLTLK